MAAAYFLFAVLVMLINSTCFCSDNRPQHMLTLEGDSSSSTRHKRFLSFNNDQSNIRIEMVFAIPFLQIPIGGKPAQGPFGQGQAAVVDVNAKSLLSASVLLFMLFFVIPKLVRVFVPDYPHAKGSTEGEGEWEVERAMRSVEAALHVNGTACWQRAVCSLARDAAQHPLTAPWATLVTSVANMKWLEGMTSETAFAEAVQAAKSSSGDCQLFYSQCPIRADQLTAFSKETARRYMNHLIQLYNAKQQQPNS